ncbi:DUF6090 family protein [Ichthyenterobacterium sp. W332]|uniref:DUF6090 family protein n=1 Tax=Microcosmobacter mediterraneus TaxID=3075607 RepID=A0ABU2YKS7_9FLAO|nr:DUF6090 family protein [Ichthyenterobacterium sp. W332]MDT0558751.1 DUF6090 family protein [Ichthyenterobacterium sp. W332]
MIKFFRHIRRSLIQENKVGKYFKYAIGEIILVVIGILIALQINNWNENKRDRNFELKMLTEVKIALENDLNHYKRMIKRVTSADSSVAKVIEHIHYKHSFHDSLYPLISKLNTGIQWQQNYGPYEGIKSSGINKISNDSLRKSLVQFYDFEYPRNLELIKWSDKNYDTDLNKLRTFRGNPFTTLNKDGTIYIRRKYQKDIFSNPDFLLLIRDFKRRTSSTLNILKSIIPHIEKLHSQINTELKNAELL